MIILTMFFSLLIIAISEFFLFRQKSIYKKNLTSAEQLNLKLGILRALSYLLLSKNPLREDLNQLDKILSTRDKAEESDKNQKEFLNVVDNIKKILLTRHELNGKLTLKQQQEAVAVKW